MPAGLLGDNTDTTQPEPQPSTPHPATPPRRFILLEGDPQPSAWSALCLSQADCTLLVAPGSAGPQLGHLEETLVWAEAEGQPGQGQQQAGVQGQQQAQAQAQTSPLRQGQGQQQQGPQQGPDRSSLDLPTGSAHASGSSLAHGSTGSGSSSSSSHQSIGSSAHQRASPPPPQAPAAGSSGTAQCATSGSGSRERQALQGQLQRVELVLLHEPGTLPSGTLPWLQQRPHLTRHHHVRLSEPKDLARLGRWGAGLGGAVQCDCTV